MGVPQGYKQVEWYGRGPHECYPDRIYGAPLRRYRVPDAAQLHTPYIFPGQDSWDQSFALLPSSRPNFELLDQTSKYPYCIQDVPPNMGQILEYAVDCLIHI